MAQSVTQVKSKLLVRHTLRAMATRFELRLAGDEERHLTAVAALAAEEIERCERLLSRFDPASETYRVNRQAFARPVRISVELCDVLAESSRARDATGGLFDITASSPGRSSGAGWDAIVIDAPARTLRFLRSDVSLDFGGFGKGYALDRAAEVLARYGVEDALLDGGSSSILALGRSPEGDPWRVSIRRPGDIAGASATGPIVAISDAALSTSWLEPHGCTILAPSAATAEMYSTALLMSIVHRRTAPLFPPGVTCVVAT